MVDNRNFVVLDGTLPVNNLQKHMRDIVGLPKSISERFAPHVPESSDHADLGTEKTAAAVPLSETPAAAAHFGTAPASAANAAVTRRLHTYFWRPLVWI